jgi:site-specific DNA-cytosine methylase
MCRREGSCLVVQTMKPRALSLFSGIGALDHGLECAGFGIAAQVENNEFCSHVLDYLWPNINNYGDIRNVDARVRDEVGYCDLVAGGFPCQPHSCAGQRKGKDDDRHLWPEFARVIDLFRPLFVLAENVPFIRNTVADEVLGDLEQRGYAAWATVVGAEDVGAPHRRDRVWFVGMDVLAFANRTRKLQEEGLDWSQQGRSGDRRAKAWQWPAAPGGPQHPWEQPRLFASMEDAESLGRRQAGADEGRRLPARLPDETGSAMGDASGGASERGLAWAGSAGGEEQGEPQCGLGSSADGPSAELVQHIRRLTGWDDARARAWWAKNKVKVARRRNRETLRAAGNSLVWPIPFLLGMWMIEAGGLEPGSLTRTAADSDHAGRSAGGHPFQGLGGS